jgi:hypothetical protein
MQLRYRWDKATCRSRARLISASAAFEAAVRLRGMSLVSSKDNANWVGNAIISRWMVVDLYQYQTRLKNVR